MICHYPHCDCPVSFPEGYKPSEATECPRCVDNETELGEYDIVGLSIVGLACVTVIWLAVLHAAR